MIKRLRFALLNIMWTSLRIIHRLYFVVKCWKCWYCWNHSTNTQPYSSAWISLNSVIETCSWVANGFILPSRILLFKFVCSAHTCNFSQLIVPVINKQFSLLCKQSASLAADFPIMCGRMARRGSSKHCHSSVSMTNNHVMYKLHGALVSKIGARSIVGCYRLTHQLHDCSCIHLPLIAETVLPKPVILADYNNIHTQTSPIIHEYYCSKSWAGKSDWPVGNYEWQSLLDPLLAVHPHIRWGRVSG